MSWEADDWNERFHKHGGVEGAIECIVGDICEKYRNRCGWCGQCTSCDFCHEIELCDCLKKPSLIQKLRTLFKLKKGA